ncbi:MAG TPA: FHA domain-containing protein, partial [Planctomycetota bacterium]|nr:FHA domain-containing protein [Planctomycetota bacterium]
MLTHRLEVEAPDQKPWTFPLRQERAVIGRAPSCDVVLKGRLVSGRHAEVFTQGDQLRIRDLGSTNGLFVNGVRRGEGPLRAGDHVRLGDCVLVVLAPLDEAAPAPAEGAARAADPTDRTLIDPFSIKLSLDEIASGIAEGGPAASGPAADFARQKMTILYRLGQEVNTVESLEAWLERVGRLVREAIGPERLALVAFDPPIAAGGPGASRAGRAVLSLDWRAPVPARAIYVPPGFVAQVVQEQKAILIQSTLFDPVLRADARVSEESIQQVMGAPLLGARGVTGLLYLDRTTARPPFTPDDLQLLGVIANQCSVMLENVRLVDEVRRALDELRATQEQLVRSARLSSLGELVAGIAHEVNNPLSAVLGYAQLLGSDAALPEGARADVRRISEQAMRVKRIVEQLLIFVRGAGSQKTALLGLNDVVAAAVEFTAYDFRAHRVAVETQLDPALPPIEAVRAELQQVIVNILQNAQQALEARGSGRVTIATRREGGRVELRIADDGPG